MRKWVIFFDIVIILLSFFIGYYFRFYSGLFPFRGIPPIKPYINITIFITSGWILILYSLSLYKEKIFSNPVKELSIIIEGSFWAMVFLMAGAFLYRGFSYSRLAIGFSGIFAFILISIFHITISKLKGSRKKVAIAGESKEIELLKKRIKLHPYINFELKEITLEEIKKEVNKKNVDFIIFASKNIKEKIEIEKLCFKYNIKLYSIPEIYFHFFSGKVEDIDGLPLIVAEKTPLNNFPNYLIKNAFDLFLGLIFSLILCLFLPFISLLIKIDSKGPVFFTQKRIGKNGKIFNIFKFRTMKYSKEENIPYTLPDDPRLTKVGKFMRKYNIDELPQIFNVLSGEMSLIGPRPISIYDTAFFKLPEFSLRLSVKPGISGWAQIHGLRGGRFEPEERIKYDIYYIENWSIYLDLAILIYSFFSFKNAI